MNNVLTTPASLSSVRQRYREACHRIGHCQSSGFDQRIGQLAYYFGEYSLGKKAATRAGFVEVSGLDPDKGLYLWGPKQSGKTMHFRAINALNLLNHGVPRFKIITKEILPYSAPYDTRHDLYVDDLFGEGQDFGMTVRLLEKRYQLFLEEGYLLYASSRYRVEDIERIAGFEVADWLLRMMNVVG